MRLDKHRLKVPYRRPRLPLGTWERNSNTGVRSGLLRGFKEPQVLCPAFVTVPALSLVCHLRMRVISICLKAVSTMPLPLFCDPLHDPYWTLTKHSLPPLGATPTGVCVSVPCPIWLNKTSPETNPLGASGLSPLFLGSCGELACGQLSSSAVPTPCWWWQPSVGKAGRQEIIEPWA